MTIKICSILELVLVAEKCKRFVYARVDIVNK
jgi:hypothetical protein